MGFLAAKYPRRVLDHRRSALIGVCGGIWTVGKGHVKGCVLKSRIAHAAELFKDLF